MDVSGFMKLSALLLSCVLKTGLNEFPFFKTKHIKGYAYASVIRKNMKKNIGAYLSDGFNTEKYYDRNCGEPA